MDSKNALIYGAHVARNVSLITLALAFSKLILAYYTNSISIMADSYHSFADIIPISAAWVGLKIAQKPRNEKFPYGYYKAENLATFVASIFIFILAYEIITKSISSIYHHSEVTHTLLGSVTMIVFVGLSYGLYLYQHSAAKKTGSQALMANARETKMDVVFSSVVLVGFVFASMGYTWIGGAVGFIISLLVIHAGYQSMRDSILSLMDAGLSIEEIEKIKKVILETPRVREVKRIYARRSGPFVMVEAEISVPANLNVNQAHMVATEVEKRLVELKEVDHAFVHVEPPNNSGKIIAIPVKENGSSSKEFGSAPYFDIYQEYNGKRELLKRVENPGAHLDKKKGVKAALFLIEQGVDRVEVLNIGEDSRKILEDSGIIISTK